MNFDDLDLGALLAADPESAFQKGLLSLLVIFAIWAARALIVALVRGSSDYLSDRQRWWISAVRNAALILGLAVMVRLWADEIGDAALSLAAVAVALVIATKELLLCLTGAIWRQVAAPFSIGDWIEIGALSGEVIETNPMSIVLQEIDGDDYQLTGRVVSVPNSQLLSQPVINNSFRKRFLYLTVDLHAEPTVNAAAARDAVIAALQAASADFAETARRYALRIEKSTGAHLPDPEPRVALSTTDLAKTRLRATLFCPRDRAPALRETATAAFLRVAAA